jgi:predicted amidohydrolase
MKYDLLISDGEVVDPNADVAILELRDGDFEFRDTDGNTVNGNRRLITHLALKDGRVCYERPAE